MHIYFDESGIFSNPHNKPNIASVVAALVIPSNTKVKLFKEFTALSARWQHSEGELKGKLLNETEIAATTTLLQKYDCLVEANVVDIGLHTDKELTVFQEQMAKNIATVAENEGPEDVKHELRDIARNYRKPKHPIFIESFLLLMLLPRLLNDAINYYARRSPKELKSFHLVIDGKDQNLTQFEQAWLAMAYPSLAIGKNDEPMQQIYGGDYTHLEKFYRPKEQLRDWQKENKYYDEENSVGISLRTLLRDLRFGNSKQHLGLQLADIIANGIQRALNGKLREDGYLGIGQLMIKQRWGAIRFCGIDPNIKKYEIRAFSSPFGNAIDAMVHQAKSIFLSEKQERILVAKAKRRDKKRLSYRP